MNSGRGPHRFTAAARQGTWENYFAQNANSANAAALAGSRQGATQSSPTSQFDHTRVAALGLAQETLSVR